jgi:hypothetical protein
VSTAAKLSEMTLDNMQFALNQVGVRGSGAGFETLDIPVTSAGSQPTYSASSSTGGRRTCRPAPRCAA